MTSRWTAVPLLVVAATYAVVGPSRALGVGLATLCAASALGLRRLELGRASQILLGLLLFGAGLALGTSLFAPPASVAPGMLRLGWSVTVLTLLLVAIGRLLAARPMGGDATTLAIGLGACAACGGSIAGPLYPAAVVAYLVSSAWALRAADPIRRARPRPAGRLLAAIGVSASLALAGAVVADATLPGLHAWMVRQIIRSLGPRTGFTDRMSLGSLAGLWESDEVVMRLRGREADYLRGAVFDRYQSGRWSVSDEGSRRRIAVARLLPAGPLVTEVELVGDEPEHYFAPLEAVEVAVPTEMAAADRAGLYSPLSAAPSTLFQFRVAPGRASRVEPPRPEDLSLEPALGRRLATMAGEWSLGVESPAGKLAAIAERLRSDYRYSLDVPSPVGDPVEHFLRRGRVGHCEYFASAMALLARSVGIPARVVAGYRAVERNELGGYLVVRERHAHAWVEAWTEEAGWRPFDPTPAAAVAAAMPSQTPWLGALGDLAHAWWAAGLRWLDRRTPTELAFALIGLVAFAAAARGVRVALERRRAGRMRESDPAPPYLALVAAALARHGVHRAPHEPLEVLEARVDRRRLPAALVADARAFLRGYAALRYGGIGDGAALEARANALVRALGALRARDGALESS